MTTHLLPPLRVGSLTLKNRAFFASLLSTSPTSEIAQPAQQTEAFVSVTQGANVGALAASPREIMQTDTRHTPQITVDAAANAIAPGFELPEIYGGSRRFIEQFLATGKNSLGGERNYPEGVHRRLEAAFQEPLIVYGNYDVESSEQITFPGRANAVEMTSLSICPRDVVAHLGVTSCGFSLLETAS